MNLTIIAVAGLLLLSSTVGAYVKGRSDGEEIQKASQSSIDDAVRQGASAAADVAASAIAGIQIKQVTIKGRIEREVQTHTIYAECRHTPDGLRNLNDALTNSVSSGPVGGVQLPASAASR